MWVLTFPYFQTENMSKFSFVIYSLTRIQVNYNVSSRLILEACLGLLIETITCNEIIIEGWARLKIS